MYKYDVMNFPSEDRKQLKNYVFLAVTNSPTGHIATYKMDPLPIM